VGTNVKRKKRSGGRSHRWPPTPSKGGKKNLQFRPVERENTGRKGLRKTNVFKTDTRGGGEKRKKGARGAGPGGKKADGAEWMITGSKKQL